VGAAGLGLYLLDNVGAATFAKTYGDKTSFNFGCDERGMTRNSEKECDVRIHAYNLILLQHDTKHTQRFCAAPCITSLAITGS